MALYSTQQQSCSRTSSTLRPELAASFLFSLTSLLSLPASPLNLHLPYSPLLLPVPLCRSLLAHIPMKDLPLSLSLCVLLYSVSARGRHAALIKQNPQTTTMHRKPTTKHQLWDFSSSQNIWHATLVLSAALVDLLMLLERKSLNWVSDV